MILDLTTSAAVEPRGAGVLEASSGDNTFGSMLERMANTEIQSFAEGESLQIVQSMGNITDDEVVTLDEFADDMEPGSIPDGDFAENVSTEVNINFSGLQHISLGLMLSESDPAVTAIGSGILPVVSDQKEVESGVDVPESLEDGITSGQSGPLSRGRNVSVEFQSQVPIRTPNQLSGAETVAAADKPIVQAGKSNEVFDGGAGVSDAGQQSVSLLTPGGASNFSAKLMGVPAPDAADGLKVINAQALPVAVEKMPAPAEIATIKPAGQEASADDSGMNKGSGNESGSDSGGKSPHAHLKESSGLFRPAQTLAHKEIPADTAGMSESASGENSISEITVDAVGTGSAGDPWLGQEKPAGMLLSVKEKSVIAQEGLAGLQSEIRVAAKSGPVQVAAEGMTLSERVVKISDLASYFDKYVSIAMDKPEGFLSIGLHPQNLGRMTMTCREDGGNISVDVVVESNFARGYLVSHESQLKAAAASSGFNIGQFNVRTDADGQRGDRDVWERAYPDDRDEKAGMSKESRPRFTSVTGNKVLFVA